LVTPAVLIYIKQARQISLHNVELEQGIHDLQEVQAQLANGNLRARAGLTGGALLPLAGSLNLMAERLMRLGQTSAYAQRLVRSLGELSVALERASAGAPLAVPPSCNEFLEINRLLVALRVNPQNVMPIYTPTAPGTVERTRTEPLAGRPGTRTVSGPMTRRPFPTFEHHQNGQAHSAPQYHQTKENRG
jgi:hypothetical protein